jgi:hypothetical protein
MNKLISLLNQATRYNLDILSSIKQWFDEGHFYIRGKRIDNAVVVFGAMYLGWCVYCYAYIL